VKEEVHAWLLSEPKTQKPVAWWPACIDNKGDYVEE
jgi:hypothetical protein